MIQLIRHPYYNDYVSDWEKYRLTFKGGRQFVDEYLEKFSSREDNADFQLRRSLSYCPAHAKSAILEIRNSIFERMEDIVRRKGPKSYQDAINGLNGGVDKLSSDMDTFIGRKILPELLPIGKVGVYIDKQPIPEGADIGVTSAIKPYLYIFQAEQILSWTYNSHNQLTHLLLSETIEETDSVTGLIATVKRQQKMFELTENGVEVSICDDKSDWTPLATLNLSRIPFVIFEMTDSLLVDVADYQIALLNLVSSDLNYLFKSNFPFYTEQINPIESLGNLVRNQSDGTGNSASAASTKEIHVGQSNGRMYAKGTERPAFINPSSEPIKVSMEKQEQIKAEIRQLIHLALTNLKPQRASADSKSKDEQGLEAGLAYIGMELAYGERQIAAIWAEYEGVKNDAEIIYPDKYSLKSDDERRKEGEELVELLPKIPSITYQKEMAKRIVDVTIGHKINVELLNQIHEEIDSAPVVAIDPDVIRTDREAGLVSDETASKARLYPPGEVEKAKKDHAERLARISAAQTTPGEITNAGARGIKDLSANPEEAKDEKSKSQNPDITETGEKPVRGEAK